MAFIQKLQTASIEKISQVLGNTSTGFTGGELAKLLFECNIQDIEPLMTKWKRLNVALLNKQKSDNCSNNIFNFIQNAMQPVRHINSSDSYKDKLFELNKILAFEGYEILENGRIQKASLKTTTIDEAIARATKLRKDLISRQVHQDVLIFCKEELLVDNYFHAVFEATKSIASKIREKTDLTSDGADLVDEAFSFKNKLPLLALNKLETKSEQSEQTGFMNLLKGIFGTFRNTIAHSAKIEWKMSEEDALDILSMISLVHRKLDKVIEVNKMYSF